MNLLRSLKWYMQVSPPSKPYSTVAVAFGSALVDGDYDQAHRLLAAEMRKALSPQALRTKLYAMFRGYSDGEPRRIHFDEQSTMDDWVGKRAGEVGWAYVGIEGDDFNEAVAVIVADIDGELLIRGIEWGRP